jgi:hypothetical protein
MSGTASIAFALLALATLLVATTALFARRSRRRRDGRDDLILDLHYAGTKHLASQVGILSGLGMGLRVPAGRLGDRRLGVQLGAR